MKAWTLRSVSLRKQPDKRFNTEGTAKIRRSHGKTETTAETPRAQRVLADREVSLLLAHCDGRIAVRFRFVYACVKESGGQIAVARY